MPFNVQVPQLSRTLLLRVGNTVAFIVTLVVNTLANTVTINGHNTGEVSDEHPTFVTPAGFTFGIWGLIYLGLFAFTIYSWTNGEEVVGVDGVLEKIGYWFMISCVANFTWLLVFHYEHMVAQLPIIVLAFASLGIINYQLTASYKTSSFLTKLCVHIPFSIYFGWLIVASTVAAFVAVTSRHGEGLEGGPHGKYAHGALYALSFLSLLGVYVVAFSHKQDLIFVAVLAWALAGIAVGQHDNSEDVFVASLLGVGVLMGLITGAAVDRIKRHVKRVQEFHGRGGIRLEADGQHGVRVVGDDEDAV